MERYVWLNLQTGEFSDSFDEEGFKRIEHSQPPANDHWKLIKYTCINDKDFLFNNWMKLKMKIKTINPIGLCQGIQSEFIIHEEYSNAWNGDMPVTLIKYRNGKIDLHCQTGVRHEKAMQIATKFLNALGFSFDYNRPMLMGPSGIYYRVERV